MKQPSKKMNEFGFKTPPVERLTEYETPIVHNYVRTVDTSLGVMFDLYSRIPKRAAAAVPRTAENIGSPAVANVTDLHQYAASEPAPMAPQAVAPTAPSEMSAVEADDQLAQIDKIEQTLHAIYTAQELEMNDAQKAA